MQEKGQGPLVAKLPKSLGKSSNLNAKPPKSLDPCRFWMPNTLWSLIQAGEPLSRRPGMQEKGQGHLVDKLPKSLGNSMGLELRESGTALNAKNAATAQAGMVFNLSLGGPCHHMAFINQSINYTFPALWLGVSKEIVYVYGLKTWQNYPFLLPDP